MFSSIRWKFILVYFLLVFIAMVVVGIFIVGKLEEQQITSLTNNIEKSIESIIESSSYIASEDWIEVQKEIQETLDEWRIGTSETLYVIYNEEVPTIIASTSKGNNKIIGQNALSYKFLNPTLILKAFGGEPAESVEKEKNEDISNKHFAYPVISGDGKVKGVMYMTSNLRDIHATTDEAKTILTNATFLALVITVFLGFLIANSITIPIRDVTKKAEEMARGDFEQFVDVKSNDEIGQLANMFNYLTLKLRDTIEEMDLERSKLDTIFNYMSEGLVAIDKENNIIHANFVAMNILDINTFQLKDINLNNIDYNKLETLEGDEIIQINADVYKVKHAPFKNENDNIGGLIIVFQDITQEHKLDNMRKEFVANVSHELKTPITTIKSYTETLMGPNIDEDINQRFLEVINSECDRMGRLVNELLQLSNIDYKKANWDKVESSVNQILTEAIKKLGLAFKEKNQSITTNLGDLPELKLDKDSIEQVFLNVLSNAMKYTEEEGQIYIDTYKEDEKIIISIKDNGIGISHEDQARIFERFYRVEKGRSRELGGTGLGLSIAREIIEAHEGALIISSEYGKGTMVNIELPIYV